MPVARALVAGGLNIMEVTFRNEHATTCIRRIAEEVPEMCVGARTPLSAAQIDEARAAGTAFGVTPGFNATVVRYAAETGFPLIPSVATPGEMKQSMELGFPTVKFFPAAADAHTPLRFVPIGGIGPENIGAYLQCSLVLAVGGSCLTDRKLAAAGDWETMTQRLREAVCIVQKFPIRA